MIFRKILALGCAAGLIFSGLPAEAEEDDDLMIEEIVEDVILDRKRFYSLPGERLRAPARGERVLDAAHGYHR